MKTWFNVSVLALLPFFSPTLGGSAWNEAVDGDLSDDPSAPTAVVLTSGSNMIDGSVTSTVPADTRDYITFTIPPGQSLLAITQNSWFDIPGGGPGNTGYIALAAGSTSLIPDAVNGSSFLGGNHITAADDGGNILPGLAAATLAGTGFSLPLASGTYTFHVQQTGPQTSGYSLNFVVGTSVPALPPLGLGILVAAMVGAGVVVFKRRQRA